VWLKRNNEAHGGRVAHSSRTLRRVGTTTVTAEDEASCKNNQNQPVTLPSRRSNLRARAFCLRSIASYSAE
jgi:hypothetical protein